MLIDETAAEWKLDDLVVKSTFRLACALPANRVKNQTLNTIILTIFPGLTLRLLGILFYSSMILILEYDFCNLSKMGITVNYYLESNIQK